MAAPTNTAWPDERIDRLRALIGEGLSVSQIAAALGDVSRNAVIGRMNRTGIKSQHKDPRSRHGIPSPRRRHRKSAGNTALRINGKADRPPLEPMQANLSLDAFNAAIPEDQPVTLMELQTWHCRWPLFDGAERSGLYCGDPNADLIEGRPYCKFHTSHAFKGFGKTPYVPNH